MAFGDTFKALSDPTRREILNLQDDGGNHFPPSVYPEIRRPD